MTTTVYPNEVGVLTAEFFQYSGGPAADVTGLTITIKTADGLTTVLGPTSTGVTHVATGLYTYSWSVSASQAVGTYLAIWSGTDAQSETVQATETVLVQALPSYNTLNQSEACYCTREDVKSALDIKVTARNNVQVDRAIQAASRSIDGQMHRVFYTTYTTRYVDWPNFQYAYPWRVWLDRAELADVTSTVPVVTTGSDVIPAANIFWGHPRYSPPYTYFELNRATGSSFGHGSTPQRDVAITGAFGFDLRTASAGALAAAVSDTTSTAITVTNGAVVGVGDTIVVDAERMLVTEKTSVTTGQTQQGSGCSTVSNADNVLAVTDGTQFAVNEVLTLDSERLLVLDIIGNSLTVKRGWDGTVLAAHSGATVYALRRLTVTRGDFGTSAATHSSSTAVSRALVPSLIRELAIAEAAVMVVQELGAYASTQGSGEGQVSKIGQGLPDLRERARREYGRKARTRTV